MISPDMIPRFYKQYKRCILKALKNDVIRTKLLDFKFDNDSLVLSIETYRKAIQAEEILNRKIKKINPTWKQYEKALKKAYYSFKKHTDFLNIAFNANPDVRIALGLLDQGQLKSPVQWFRFALKIYDMVLDDYPILEQLDAFNITTDQLIKGREDVQNALESYKELIMERPGAKVIIETRDGLILELQYIMFELEIICIYALEDKPDLIAELGLPIMHSPLAPNGVKVIPKALKKTKIRFKKELREAAMKGHVNNEWLYKIGIQIDEKEKGLYP